MRKLPAKVTLFVVTSYSLFLSGWEEENSKILASVDLVDLAIVIIFAVWRCFGGYSTIKVKRETGESPVQSRCCKSYQTL